MPAPEKKTPEERAEEKKQEEKENQETKIEELRRLGPPNFARTSALQVGEETFTWFSVVNGHKVENNVTIKRVGYGLLKMWGGSGKINRMTPDADAVAGIRWDVIPDPTFEENVELMVLCIHEFKIYEGKTDNGGKPIATEGKNLDGDERRRVFQNLEKDPFEYVSNLCLAMNDVSIKNEGGGEQ